jgi:hypothetical protein
LHHVFPQKKYTTPTRRDQIERAIQYTQEKGITVKIHRHITMDEIIKTAWADAKTNADFIYIETYSGYRRSQADPKGVQFLVSPNISDDELGSLILNALIHSRFVLPEPRNDVWVHPEATFDLDLYDYTLNNQRYAEWLRKLMEAHSYKTKRALFKDMKSCSIESKSNEIIIRPSHHEKLEGWSGKGISEADHVIIPDISTPSNVGSALRLAFSRCT